MSPSRNTPRLFREAFDKYVKAAIFAVILIPITPDIATDIAAGDITAAMLRIGIVVLLIALAVALLWTSRRRSGPRQLAARAKMTGLDTCHTLILPLSRVPEYRHSGREQAESVPELLIDGHGALHPRNIVLVRSPQIDEADFVKFTDNLAQGHPQIRVITAAVTDVNDPNKVFDQVKGALDDIVLGQPDDIAIDLTGGTALMSLGLAKLAHELNARCVYISSDRGRGQYGRFVLGTQNRHIIDVDELFAE
jgi:hypothetical protein